MLGLGYGSSAVGDSLNLDLGVQLYGLRSFGHRAFLAQWDSVMVARADLLGNTLPYTWLAGMDTLATGEVGYRWMRARRFSPYTGAGLGGELSVLTRPGTPIGRLDELNNLDGVGGLNVRGHLRADAGLSFLDDTRSVLLLGFLQEQLIAPGIYSSGISFTEGGLALRVDTVTRLTVSFDLAAGRSPVSSDAALMSHVQTTRVELAALVRKVFRDRAWLALGGGFTRDFDRRSYAGTPNVYRTASAPAFNVNLVVGVSLDRRRRIYGP